MLLLGKIYFQNAKNSTVKSVLCTLNNCLEYSGTISLRKYKLGGCSDVPAVTTKVTMGKQFPQSGMSSASPVTLWKTESRVQTLKMPIL